MEDMLPNDFFKPIPPSIWPIDSNAPIFVPPPYDYDDADCDKKNPNIRDKEVWEMWLKSIDLVLADYDGEVYSAKNIVVKNGHRGIQLYDNGLFNWYYNIIGGIKYKTRSEIINERA